MRCKVKIGYQGIQYSNSEYAAKKFIEQMDLSDIELIPLINSKNVVDALLNKEIDYGVIAIKNSTAGDVIESITSLQNTSYHILDNLDLEINHCLFKLKDNIQIKNIASHIQAVKQCQNNIKEMFPDAEIIEIEDTALGAIHLKEGKLQLDTGVICSKEAGLSKDLTLVKENMQDIKGNKTTFIIFKLEE
ncbi:hypothetical protein AN396_03075 [Candidatus Epulonipiscium fishelsonii]|uniref:Uncharacterized protein n=1 Tax=Candidatus Epulonipiscium fishelsonii TaxID=77094 RepID=A0ACC8XEY0_9FIRM|nr:hypothetical protein AN396_03075 [Epulopiscium sp. SCG-B11WGA-EpuloA1]